MMKKIFLVVFSLVTLVSILLTGCGSEDSAPTETPAAETPTGTEVTVETPVEATSTVTEEATTTDETASADQTTADGSASTDTATEDTTEETAETVSEETAETTSAYEGASQAGCEDTDGGKNYGLYGTIVDAHGTTDYDRCSENENFPERLYESYCAEDGKRQRETYECPSGKCEAGACAAAEEATE